MPLEIGATPNMERLARNAAGQSSDAPVQNESTAEIAELFGRLNKTLEALAQTSEKGSNTKISDRALKSIEAVQKSIETGRNPSALAIEKALRALGQQRLELSQDYQKFSQEQQKLTEKILKDLNKTTRFMEEHAPRTHTWAKRAGAGIADHFGKRNYYDAMFGSAESRAANGYRGRMSSMARAFAGNHGMGDLFDAIFQSVPQAARAGTMGGGASQRRESIQAQQRHAEAMEQLETETEQLGSATEKLDTNVVQLRTSNDQLRRSVDQLREEFKTDSKERARQAILDRQNRHEAIQATNVLKFPGGNRAQSMLDKASNQNGDGGGLLDMLTSGFGLLGAIGGGAGIAGALGKLRNRMPRPNMRMPRLPGGGRAKLLMGLLGAIGGGVALNEMLGQDDTNSGNNQGNNTWTPQMVPNNTSTNTLPQNTGNPVTPQRFVPNAVINDPIVDPNATGDDAWMAQPGPGHGNQIMLLEKSRDGNMYRYMDQNGDIGMVGTRLIQPLQTTQNSQSTQSAQPEAQYDAMGNYLGGSAVTAAAPLVTRTLSTPGNVTQLNQSTQTIASTVSQATIGRRIPSSKAMSLGKSLLGKALGPLSFAISAYAEYEYLEALYGMRMTGEITEAEFQTEFAASLAALLGGPAGAAIGAKLGAIGGGAAGAFVGGIGAAPGAAVGGLAGAIAGWFGGEWLAENGTRQIMDQINGSTGLGDPVNPSSTTQTVQQPVTTNNSTSTTTATPEHFGRMPSNLPGWIGGNNSHNTTPYGNPTGDRTMPSTPTDTTVRNGQVVPNARAGGVSDYSGNESQADRMKGVYDAFRAAGLPHEAAKSFAAEIGRENDFRERFMFGTHTDANNGQMNGGMMSWQKERFPKMMEFLRQRGQLNPDGSIKQTQEALNAQAAFAIQEMQDGTLGDKGRQALAVLNDPNSTHAQRAEVLGRNVIKWDMDGRRLADPQTHANKRDNYYTQFGAMTDNTAASTNQPVESTTQNTTPSVPLGTPTNVDPNDQFGFKGNGSFEGVDPRLQEILKATAAEFPLRTRVMSGKMGRNSGAHSHGNATDISLYDQDGNVLPNYQNSEYFRAYELFAQSARKKAAEMYPDLVDGKGSDFNWGGLFGDNGNGGYKYGSNDTMDFRLAPNNLFRAGTINSGLNERHSFYDNNDILGGSKPYSDEAFAADMEKLRTLRLTPEQVARNNQTMFGVARASGTLGARPDVQYNSPQTGALPDLDAANANLPGRLSPEYVAPTGDPKVMPEGTNTPSLPELNVSNKDLPGRLSPEYTTQSTPTQVEQPQEVRNEVMTAAATVNQPVQQPVQTPIQMPQQSNSGGCTCGGQGGMGGGLEGMFGELSPLLAIMNSTLFSGMR